MKKNVTFTESEDDSKGKVSDKQKNWDHVKEDRKGTWIGVGTETWTKMMKVESMEINKTGPLEETMVVWG